MSDTPEIDLHCEEMDTTGIGVCSIGFTRKLERERDSALQLARELRGPLEQAVAYPITGDWYCNANEALTKAKKLLPP